jgi:hypothetical protein
MQYDGKLLSIFIAIQSSEKEKQAMSIIIEEEVCLPKLLKQHWSRTIYKLTPLLEYRTGGTSN